MTPEALERFVAALLEAGIRGLEQRVAILKTITIRTDDLCKIEEALLDLYKETRSSRLAYRAARLAGVPVPKSDSSILAIAGASHVGKSRAIKSFVADVLPFADVGRGSLPMVHAELSSDATIKTVWSDVLTAMNDPHPDGTRLSMENRVAQLALQHETEIIVLDECQHLTHRTRSSPKLADTLKKNVQRGQFALVLVGQEQEVNQIVADIQIENRSAQYLLMEKASIDSDEDISRFRDFLANLDRTMVERGVFAEESRLASDETLERMFVASDGLVGVASKIITRAVRRGRVEDRFLTEQALQASLDMRRSLRSRKTSSGAGAR